MSVKTVAMRKAQLKDMRQDLEEIRMSDGIARFDHGERAEAKRMLVARGVIDDSYRVTDEALTNFMKKLDEFVKEDLPAVEFKVRRSDSGFTVKALEASEWSCEYFIERVGPYQIWHPFGGKGGE